MKYTVVHGIGMGGNSRACMASFKVRGRIVPTYTLLEALALANELSVAHGDATATVVQANAKLTIVYGPVYQ